MVIRKRLVIRLDKELRDSLTAKAASEQRAVAQVVRDLIIAYVSDKPIASNALITPIDRIQRSEAVSFARASVFLEGFTPSLEAEGYAQQFINGEITLEQFANRKVGQESAGLVDFKVYI